MKLRSKKRHSRGRPLRLHAGDLTCLTRLEFAQTIAATGIITITTHTIGNFVEAGLPENKDRTLDIRKVCAFLILQRRQRIEKVADVELAGPPSYTLERWRRARAKLAELDLAARKGDLVKLAEVKREFQEKGARLKTVLETVASRFGKECREAFDSALGDSLNLPSAERGQEPLVKGNSDA
jgi:phage terminase Nu1 subunit (DNA packaging protein)